TLASGGGGLSSVAVSSIRTQLQSSGLQALSRAEAAQALPSYISAPAPLAKPDPIPTSRPRGPLADARREANLECSNQSGRPTVCFAPERTYLQHLALSKEATQMRQFDLSPLYRSTIGFDRLFNMIDQAAGFEAAPAYPPYNIERTGENAYRISVAV